VPLTGLGLEQAFFFHFGHVGEGDDLIEVHAITGVADEGVRHGMST